MGNPNPKNQFNSVTGKAAASLSTKTKHFVAKTEKQIAKIQAGGIKEAELLSLAKAFLGNPAVIGTILFLLVRSLNTSSKSGYVSPATISPIAAYLQTE